MLPRFTRPWKLLLLLLVVHTDAYRLGDAVDTIMWTKNESNTMKRAEMPMFGEFSRATIDIKEGLFSFGFEDGLHMLPWIEAKDLKKIVVTFVFSKSGDGAIHSVSTSMERGTSEENSFAIEYRWVEEAPVELQAGVCVMLLASLVASVVFLLQACSIVEENQVPVPAKTAKWDLRGHEE
jgi:hypothetical protein